MYAAMRGSTRARPTSSPRAMAAAAPERTPRGNRGRCCACWYHACGTMHVRAGGGGGGGGHLVDRDAAESHRLVDVDLLLLLRPPLHRTRPGVREWPPMGAGVPASQHPDSLNQSATSTVFGMTKLRPSGRGRPGSAAGTGGGMEARSRAQRDCYKQDCTSDIWGAWLRVGRLQAQCLMKRGADIRRKRKSSDRIPDLKRRLHAYRLLSR